MHPALRPYVVRPSPRLARYVFVGALTGFAGVALSFAIVHVIDVRHGNDRQAEIERRHEARARCAHRATGVMLSRTIAHDLAVRAWPSWVADHPDRACPTSIAELAPYLGSGTEVDSWGHAYHFACGGSRLSVGSDGPDGIRGTRDDLWSDR